MLGGHTVHYASRYWVTSTGPDPFTHPSSYMAILKTFLKIIPLSIAIQELLLYESFQLTENSSCSSVQSTTLTQSYCAKCLVKGSPASISTSESSRMRTKGGSVPEVKLLSETIRWVLLHFWRGRKKTTDTLVQVFIPVNSQQEENRYSEKKGDVLTEANKVNRQLMLFPNTWQMKTILAIPASDRTQPSPNNRPTAVSSQPLPAGSWAK